MISVEMQKVSLQAYQRQTSWISRQLEWFGYSDMNERISPPLGMDLNNFSISITTAQRLYLQGSQRQQSAFSGLVEKRLTPLRGTVSVNVSVFSLSEVIRRMRASPRTLVKDFVIRTLNAQPAYHGTATRDMISVLGRADMIALAHVPLAEADSQSFSALGLALMLFSGAHLALINGDEILGGGALIEALGREIKIAFCAQNLIMTGRDNAPAWFTPERELRLI